jgi:hypothetical protein
MSGVVGQLDGFSLRVGRAHRGDRGEYFFVSARCVPWHFGQHGRLEKEAFTCHATAPAKHSRSPAHSILDGVERMADGGFVNERANLGAQPDSSFASGQRSKEP